MLQIISKINNNDKWLTFAVHQIPKPLLYLFSPTNTMHAYGFPIIGNQPQNIVCQKLPS
jgi:hypothetical protein